MYTEEQSREVAQPGQRGRAGRLQSCDALCEDNETRMLSDASLMTDFAFKSFALHG